VLFRRYQSITNWFQNQRSLAKKRNEDFEAVASRKSSTVPAHESRTFSAFPPPSNHPSLSLSLSLNHNHPSRSATQRTRPSSIRATSALPLDTSLSSRGSTPPYRNANGHFPRPRRTRPEPYQLDALKDLFTRTSNPSIEERSALALEIGMYVIFCLADLGDPC